MKSIEIYDFIENSEDYIELMEHLENSSDHKSIKLLRNIMSKILDADKVEHTFHIYCTDSKQKIQYVKIIREIGNLSLSDGMRLVNSVLGSNKPVVVKTKWLNDRLKHAISHYKYVDGIKIEEV